MPNERPLTPEEVEEIQKRCDYYRALHPTTVSSWEDFITAGCVELPRALETIRQQAERIKELERELAASRRLVEACDPEWLDWAGWLVIERATRAKPTGQQLIEIARLAREAREAQK